MLIFTGFFLKSIHFGNYDLFLKTSAFFKEVCAINRRAIGTADLWGQE